MHDPKIVSDPPVAPRPSTKLVSPSRTLAFLVLATVVLLVLIGLAGDVRRKRNAMEQAGAFAATLTARLGQTNLLPLNLGPDGPARGQGNLIPLEWLTRDEARRLRGGERRVMAGQTVPIPRSLAPAGRAVVFFEDGRFHVGWMTLARFDRSYSEQRHELQRRGPGPKS